MSMAWGKWLSREGSLRNHERSPREQVRGLKTAGSVPAALSQNPLGSPGGRLPRYDRPGAVKSHADDRPDFATRRKLLDDLARAEYDEGIYGTVPQVRPDFWDFVYWAGWGLTGFLALILAASVAKAIRYGVITDIINWMLHR